jgi:predicted metal-dependent phosphoesterase TrpH
MPAGQPFTSLCQQAARPRQAGRADLHVHTTASDGAYTPAQIVDLARRSGLAAVAITDHDTLEGIEPARRAGGAGLEIVPGVEITAEHRGRELHLLGYFVRPDDEGLGQALAGLRQSRRERFRQMVERLTALGVPLEREAWTQGNDNKALGRRHLAELVVKAGRAATVRHAFQKYLGDHGRVSVANCRLPVAEAIALVRGAGGVASWAHPTYDCTQEVLRGLRALGLEAVEADFPSCRPGRSRELRTWASGLELAVTGGSDCHGPEGPRRALGACGVTLAELEQLRAKRRP